MVRQTTKVADVTPASAEQNVFTEALENAFVGFCSHNVDESAPILVFGSVNDRPLENKAVQSLRLNFFRQGVRRNDTDTYIQAGIDASLLGATQPVKTAGALKDYPTLSSIFADTTPTKKRIIYPYSGQHRVEAIKTFRSKLLDPRGEVCARDILNVRRRISEAETELQRENISEDSTREVNELLEKLRAELTDEEELLARIQGFINEGTTWVIKLYDKSELVSVLLHISANLVLADKLTPAQEEHLSANDDVYRYQVTLEEHIYGAVRKMALLEDQLEAARNSQDGTRFTSVTSEQKALEKAIRKEGLATGAKEKHKDIARIIGSKHTLRMLICLTRFGTCFRHMPELKASWLKANMFNVFGGVSYLISIVHDLKH